MRERDWKRGRSIEEIKANMSPSTEETEQIEQEVRKQYKSVHLNVMSVSEEASMENLVTTTQYL